MDNNLRRLIDDSAYREELSKTLEDLIAGLKVGGYYDEVSYIVKVRDGIRETLQEFSDPNKVKHFCCLGRIARFTLQTPPAVFHSI